MIKRPTKISQLIVKFGIIPPEDFLAITMFGYMFINKKNKTYWEELGEYKQITYIHEGIHLMQAQNDGFWFIFYCKYLWWWLKAIILSGFDNDIAYYCIPYEVEAHIYEQDPNYKCERTKVFQNIPIRTLVNLKKNSSTYSNYIESIKNLFCE